MKKLVASGIMALFGCAGTASAGEVDAWIDAETVDDKVRLRSMVVSDADVDLTYTLTVERVSAAGTSKTSQGGRYSAEGGIEGVMSTSAVNQPEGGVLTAYLEVRDAAGQVWT
ncbi:MAG: curli-like amyloid fiber formation chaperone CsgH, partial [Henriciella sp.]|uniref:curli-like amyloid fiber formation chaperone CsgH n=1 Tax=Henriciella sp. TaxID=1968823 RepID=UPI003C708713